jgi:hypothetical protein
MLVDQGFTDDAILDWVRLAGIDSRPTAAEFQELWTIGASPELISGLRTAVLPYPWEVLPGAVTLPWTYSPWPPLQFFPGLPPFPCRHWIEGWKRLAPGTVEPLP